MAEKLTQREIVLEAFKALFENIHAGEPLNNPYQLEWKIVTRSPITSQHRKRRTAIGLYDVREKKADRIGVMDATIEIILEFYILLDTGEKPSPMLNLALGEIQRTIGEDTSIGGLAIDVKEVSNEFDIGSEEDRQVSGAIFLELKYRHRTDNPYLAA